MVAQAVSDDIYIWLPNGVGGACAVLLISLCIIFTGKAAGPSGGSASLPRCVSGRQRGSKPGGRAAIPLLIRHVQCIAARCAVARAAAETSTCCWTQSSSHSMASLAAAATASYAATSLNRSRS